MKRIIAIMACALSIAAQADVTGWSLSIEPTAPVDLQPVYATISVNQTCVLDPSSVTARQEGGSIFVTVKGASSSCIPTGGTTTANVSLGQFHVGQFSVGVISTEGTQLTSGAFQVTAPTAPRAGPLIDYTDIWWDPKESGWGIGITHHPSGQLFAVWYAYDTAGGAAWLTLQPGVWSSGRTFSGPIYRTTGPWFGQQQFDPSKVSVTQAGSGTLTFDSPTTGTFTYTVDGVSSSRPIQRMTF